RPERRAGLDGALGRRAEPISECEQPPGRAQCNVAVEQRFGIATEKVLVARLSNTEVESQKSAFTAASHQPQQQLLARAFDGETTQDDRIEHGAETAASDNAAHGRDDNVVD